MAQHKNQRVAVFVDVQNMYYSAKQLYHSKVNFAKILTDAVAGRQLIRSFAYAISADVGKEEEFHEALSRIGYDVKLKDLQIFYGGAKKGDWDVGIAMDVLKMANKVDVIVLVSGDGDFKELLEYVKHQGCRTEVMAFDKAASGKLKSEAGQFTDLGSSKKYLIGARSTPRKQNGKSNARKV